jgi:hypothetical protein
MDYRLDLFNAVNNYVKKMTQDEAVFVIAFNSRDKDLMMALDGNTDLISHIMSNIEIKSEEERAHLETSKAMILNIAINILNTDRSLMNKFKIVIESIDNISKEDRHQIN